MARLRGTLPPVVSARVVVAARLSATGSGDRP
jgi:hypothetical protein